MKSQVIEGTQHVAGIVKKCGTDGKQSVKQQCQEVEAKWKAGQEQPCRPWTYLLRAGPANCSPYGLNPFCYLFLKNKVLLEYNQTYS